MKNISLPKKFIVEETVKGKKAKVIIEPCFPGYGTTLGNALRRVMLSSLIGGAVTAVKINGIQHEFSALENMTEDIIEIILNLKKIRIKVYSDEPVVLRLAAKGEKTVTAGDIEPSADAEIFNKDQVIATLNDAGSKLEMEITAQKGIGYVTTEERDTSKEKGEIGLILVDAIFTPVLSVGLDIEATRVGQKTDYDKIILTIETDGTISPEEAVKKAAEILVSQFSWLISGGSEEVAEVDLEAPVIVPEKPEQAIGEMIEPPLEPEEGISEEIEASDQPAKAEEAKPKKRGRPRKTET